MLCKLVTLCGCFQYKDLPEDLAHHSFRMPLPSKKVYMVEDTPLVPDMRVREFRYEGHLWDSLLHVHIPVLVERD